ncbi:MAG: nucleoside-diphosphate kinase [Chlamydiia bacterium]|nr:nucleoside-diphosphate kinase [Chlamydiia bacterium]
MLKKLLFALVCVAALNAEQTLAVIKPDAVKNNHIGAILDLYESNGLKIAGLKMVKLSPEQAGKFYAVHKDRPFYPDLKEFFSSGPIVAIVLEGDNAVAKNREIMGATNPAQAKEGTIRKRFAESMSKNAVHGSDSLESANVEIPFFFQPSEIQLR